MKKEWIERILLGLILMVIPVVARLQWNSNEKVVTLTTELKMGMAEMQRRVTNIETLVSANPSAGEIRAMILEEVGPLKEEIARLKSK
jgi:hypothetical protein